MLLGNTDPTQGKYLVYDMLVGVGALSEIIPTTQSFIALEKYQRQVQDWLFGYMSYDLKNELEDLSSSNSDRLQFPQMHFFNLNGLLQSKIRCKFIFQIA